ncbi:MAG: c-type cytochrome [Chitinophagaceae bacterium]
MKKFLLLNALIVVFSAACLSFTHRGSRQAGITASLKRGEDVFAQNCLGCHQADGGGVPNLNPSLIKTKWVLGDKKALIKVVLQGLSGEIVVNDDTYNNAMPPQDFLNDQQVADVLTYVRNSFGNKAAAVKPAEVKAVRAKLKL